MSKYHINPETGNPGVCKATRKCRFGDLEADHYASKEEASAAYERQMNQAQTLTQQEEAAQSPVYSFPAEKLAIAKNEIAKANRRAERAGIEERITYDVRTYERTEKDRNGFTITEERVDLTLHRPVLKHDGWTFAGTMSWDPEIGLITRMAPEQSLMEKPKEKLCDVCGQERTRNDTYIVQKNGEQKQVGSNCLKRFMGIKPAGLWMLDYDLDVKEGYDDDRGLSDSGRSARRDTKEMIGLGMAIVESYGWTPRSTHTRNTPTADRVDEILYGTPKTEAQRKEYARLRARGKELTKDAPKILKEAQEIEGHSEYADNLRKLAAADSVGPRNVPLLLSAIGNHERNKARAVEKKAAAVSQWVGTKGEKLPERTMTVAAIKTIESNYGYQTTSSQLVTFKDSDGNIYKTFYSGRKEVKEGASYNIAGTVKDHKEWNGAKETMMARVKFQDIPPAVAPPTKLPNDSVYAQTKTKDETDKVANAESRRIVREFKKRAGADNWDTHTNRPWDQTLASELFAKLDEDSKLYQARYREIQVGENDE